MTRSGKIRIYELSRDLHLDNKDVLFAAGKLSIAAKSHSSSISESEAKQIKDFLSKARKPEKEPNTTQNASNKEILSVKKTSSPKQKTIEASEKKAKKAVQDSIQKPSLPIKPITKSSVKENKSPQIAKPPSPPSNKPLVIKPNPNIKPSQPRISIQKEKQKINEKVPKQSSNNTPKGGAKKPQIIKSNEPINQKSNSSIPKTVASPNRPIPRPEQTNSPKPQKPLAPPSRPQQGSPNRKNPAISSQGKTKSNPYNNFSHKNKDIGKQYPGQINRSNSSKQTGKPPIK